MNTEIVQDCAGLDKLDDFVTEVICHLFFVSKLLSREQKSTCLAMYYEWRGEMAVSVPPVLS